MWWTVFIGAALGVAQVFAMRFFAAGIGSSKRDVRRPVFALVNVVVVAGAIVLFALMGADAALWAVGGMTVTMIVLSIVLYIRSMGAPRDGK